MENDDGGWRVAVLSTPRWTINSFLKGFAPFAWPKTQKEIMNSVLG